MPLFCRHNRFEASCPICAREKAPARTASRARARAGAAPRAAAPGARRPAGMVTKRLARAADDGYRNELVPGLRATADAERLAAALTIAAARLERRQVLEDPLPAAAAEAFGDPAVIERWTPPQETVGWTPERRFARWMDRLRLPGTTRAQRFGFLVALGPSCDLEAGALFFDVKGDDPATIAAKRALGSGDAMLLERRAAALAQATGVPIAALDQALVMWDGSESLAEVPEHGAIRSALGL